MKQIAESEVKNFLNTHPGFEQKNNATGKDSKLRTYLVKTYSPKERFGRFLIGLVKTLLSLGLWLKSKAVRDQLFFAKKTVIQIVCESKNVEVIHTNPINGKTDFNDKIDSSDKRITRAKVEYLVKINFPSVSTKNLEMPVLDIDNNVIHWPYVELGCCFLENLQEILERMPEPKEVQLKMPTSNRYSEKFKKNIVLLIESKIKVSIQFDKGFSDKPLKSMSVNYLLEMLEPEDLESFWHTLTPSSKEEILKELASNLIISKAAQEMLNKLPDQDLKQLALYTLEKDPKKFGLILQYLSSREKLILEILLKNTQPNSLDILSQLVDHAILAEGDATGGQMTLHTPNELKSKQGKLVQLAFELLSETQLNDLIVKQVKNKYSKAESLHRLLKFAKKGTVAEEILRGELLESCVAERFFYTKKVILKNLLLDLSNNDWKNLVERLVRNNPKIFQEFISFLGKDKYQFIIEHLLNLETEKLSTLFDVNNFSKDFLKKVLQKLKASRRDAPLLLDKLESQIRTIVSKKVTLDLKSFSKDSDELDLVMLNIYLKFPVAKRKWLETVNYFKNVKKVVNLPESFIPNEDQHKVGTLVALEHLVTSGLNPLVESNRVFSPKEWEEISSRKAVLDHLYFDRYTYVRVPVEQIPLFIAQWLEIGRHDNKDIELVQDAISKGLRDPKFLQNLSTVLGEQSLENLLTLLISKETSWGYGHNWFEKNLLSLLKDPQLVLFYDLLKDEYVFDLINHTKQVTLYQHFLALVQSETNQAPIKKFILGAIKAYDYEHLIQKSESREKKLILRHLPLYYILSSKKYFSEEDIYEETHRRLQELPVEEIANYRDLFTQEDLENRANQVLKEITINENDPESFKEAFKILARARSLTPNICLLNPEYGKNLYGDSIFLKINYTRNEAFIKPSEGYLRDLIALNAFYIRLTTERRGDSIVSTLNWILKMSYQEHESEQGALLGKGLAYFISSNDISTVLIALMKTPRAAQALTLGLLKNNDQMQIQIAFRTLLFSSYMKEKSGESLLTECLAFIDTKEKLEWIIAVWPEDDSEMEKTLLNSIPTHLLSQEEVLAAIKAPRRLSLISSIDCLEIEEKINQFKEELQNAQSILSDRKKYLSFSVKWFSKLNELEETLKEMFQQDAMNPRLQELLGQIQDLYNQDRKYHNKIKLPFYTKKVNAVKLKLSGLKEIENKDLVTLFPILKVCKRKVQRIPEYSQDSEISKVIEEAAQLEMEIDTLFMESCDGFIKNAQKNMEDIKVQSWKSFGESSNMTKAYEQLLEMDSIAVNVLDYLQYFTSESYKKMTLDLRNLRGQIYDLDQSLRESFKDYYRPSPKTENKWLAQFLEKENYDLNAIQKNVEGNKVLLSYVSQLEGLLKKDSINHMAPLFGFAKLPETENEFSRAVVKAAAPCHPDKHFDWAEAATSLFGLIKGIGKQILHDHYGVDSCVPPDPTWRKN